MKDTTIAVGLAKNVFEIAISREAGKVSKQLRVSRPKLVSFFAKQSAATVLLEACVSAHFWARTLRRLGHDDVLLPPHLVRPYRRGRNGLGAMAEPITRSASCRTRPMFACGCPTGGGKTVLAAHSIAIARDAWIEKDWPMVLWSGSLVIAS